MRCIVSLIILITAILSISEIEVRLKVEILLECFKAVAWHPLCERFVQPEIVPPGHRHVVAEPVMWQFMRHNQGGGVKVECGRIIRQHSALVEGHDSCVLHREWTELSDEDLVVFVEGKLNTKIITVEFHAFYCDIEDELGVCFELLLCCWDAEEGHGNRTLICWDLSIISCTETEDITGEKSCPREEGHFGIGSISNFLWKCV